MRGGKREREKEKGVRSWYFLSASLFLPLDLIMAKETCN